jgi:succinate dehydrogenase / fumarate reductase iron-sulfur subunit
VGGVLASAFVGPSLRSRPPQWVALGPLDRYPVGEVSTVGTTYETTDGLYRQQVVKPVLVRRTSDILVFNSSCTHLGCTVRWDAGQKLFLCACHGGAFNPDGSVKSGPPPRPLDRLEHRVDNGNLLVKMV